jgi:uncharacterized Ntn-hydrolase superfamily protein
MRRTAWLLLLCGCATSPAAAPDGVSATFSIVAVDPETGACGAAVASKYPSVGTVVPYARAGVGAFCTQHWHNPKFGPRALDLLAAGKLPEEVLGLLLQDDKNKDKRQLLIIDLDGRAAVRNPSAPDLPGAVWWGSMAGRNFACAGNTLAGREVVVAMAKAFEETPGSLADRLLAALVAGDRAGGDHRGRLAAGLRVAKKGVDGLWLDLQVDQSADAVEELRKKYEALEHPAKGPPILALKGTLERSDLEGGMWLLKQGGRTYDLHGVPAGFQAGDAVEVEGVLPGGACIHMHGTILKVLKVRKSP